VGGFFFLRFMCPAIISPEGFGVLADGQVLLDEARRALVLVSKLLQNLANGKLFGSKEAYMVPMQEFILSHQEEIKDFFDELAVSPFLQHRCSFSPLFHRISYTLPLLSLSSFPCCCCSHVFYSFRCRL
jgi:hypothetical protein